MRSHPGQYWVVASAALFGSIAGITINPGVDSDIIASGAIQDSRIENVVSERYRYPSPFSSGTFTNGPPGLEAGAILTTGLANQAPSDAGKALNVNFGYSMMTPDGCVLPTVSYEHVLIDFTFDIPPSVSGIKVNLLFASQEITISSTTTSSEATSITASSTASSTTTSSTTSGFTTSSDSSTGGSYLANRFFVVLFNKAIFLGLSFNSLILENFILNHIDLQTAINCYAVSLVNTAYIAQINSQVAQ
nr:uncharacterized protein CTRU02_09902 [Colletotrichum truncatum]KAF6788089.1 hypothetical protein CTRU02_09902 [Colletotrichum truncatum]